MDICSNYFTDEPEVRNEFHLNDVTVQIINNDIRKYDTCGRLIERYQQPKVIKVIGDCMGKMVEMEITGIYDITSQVKYIEIDSGDREQIII